jgi:splicing factor 3B subunit 3
MTSFSTMSLYALTVQPPSATQDALVGDFSGAGRQQILSSGGSRLAILEVSRRQKGFQEIYSQDLFGIIRHVAKFRLAGGTKGTRSRHTRRLGLIALPGTMDGTGWAVFE